LPRKPEGTERKKGEEAKTTTRRMMKRDRSDAGLRKKKRKGGKKGRARPGASVVLYLGTDYGGQRGKTLPFNDPANWEKGREKK